MRCRSNRRDRERDGSNLQVKFVHGSPPLKGQRDYQPEAQEKQHASLQQEKRDDDQGICSFVSCVCCMSEVTARGEAGGVDVDGVHVQGRQSATSLRS